MARHAARHAAPKKPSGRRTLLRAGLTVSAVGVALAGGAASASAAPAEPRTAAADTDVPAASMDTSPLGVLTGAVQHSAAGGIAPIKDLQLDPLAGTSVDPLSNAIGTQIADFKPVSTAVATGPLAEGGSLEDLPLVGEATGLLPG